MKPHVSTRGKSALLSYELPHRVHDAKVYPIKASNGSSICIYGHENGVRILWRGGRPLKKVSAAKAEAPRPRKVNGNSAPDVIMIDDSDDDQPTQASAKQPEPAEYESEEEELDPDEPYATIIQEVHVPLNVEVFHIAVPQVPTISALRAADSFPSIFQHRMIFTVACADFSVRIIALPLDPPSAATASKASGAAGHWGEQVIKITSHAGHQSIPRDISMTWTASSEPAFEEGPTDTMDIEEDGSSSTPRRRARRNRSRSRSTHVGEPGGWDLLLASYSADLGGLLRIWRFPIGDDKSHVINAPHPILAYQTVRLSSPVSRIAFSNALYPKKRHSQLLIVESSGLVKVYDPFAPKNRRAHLQGHAIAPEDIGACIAIFRASWEPSKGNTPTIEALARRKPILDAAWASDGRAIVALLEDGEWGIWDIDRSGPKPHWDPTTFSLRGFVANAASASSTAPKPRNNRTSLAPMTPNTRRTREENLFHGPATSSAHSKHGGVIVASLLSDKGGPPEDTVVFWYNNEVYRISKLAQFWTRAAEDHELAPGLTRIQPLNLHGESIAAVEQFSTTLRESRLAIPRDILIAAENRLLISTVVPTPTEDSDAGKIGREESRILKMDKNLLESGELDIGGLDRMLDAMDAPEEAPRRGLLFGNNPRRVLFASSTNE